MFLSIGVFLRGIAHLKNLSFLRIFYEKLDWNTTDTKHTHVKRLKAKVKKRIILGKKTVFFWLFTHYDRAIVLFCLIRAISCVSITQKKVAFRKKHTKTIKILENWDQLFFAYFQLFLWLDLPHPIFKIKWFVFYIQDTFNIKL